jgi:chromosome segregation ATPase
VSEPFGIHKKPGGWLAPAAVPVAFVAAALCAGPAAAQQTREHAQLLIMQQQMQRLEQENTSLKTQKSDLEQSSEALKKKSESAQKESSHLKARTAGLQQQNEQLTADLTAARDALAKSTAEAEQLRSELTQKAEALRTLGEQASDQLKRFERERASLTGTLTSQTARADHCEAKHAGLMTFAGDLLARYEKIDLRHTGDPVFGFGKVAEEKRIQDLRDQLFDLQLEPAALASPHAGP